VTAFAEVDGLSLCSDSIFSQNVGKKCNQGAKEGTRIEGETHSSLPRFIGSALVSATLLPTFAIALFVLVFNITRAEVQASPSRLVAMLSAEQFFKNFLQSLGSKEVEFAFWKSIQFCE
jgi:hypothetical protein